MSERAAFAAALLAREAACPPGLTVWNGSAAAARFAVYRNNVTVSLIDALADTFPVVQALLGEPCFRALAREFLRSRPPTSPILADYGEALPAFLEGFEPVACLPYLADVARLEYYRLRARDAADASPLPATEWRRLLDDEALLPKTRLVLQPAAHVLTSPYAVLSLWAAHQNLLAFEDIATDQAESALILRAGFDVEVWRISPGAATFVRQLQQEHTFGVAADIAGAEEPAFDLADILGTLIRGGAITAATPERTNEG